MLNADERFPEIGILMSSTSLKGNESILKTY